MARIAVAGSGLPGSTGRHVADHARSRGHQVVELAGLEDESALDRGLTGADGLVLIPLRGDARLHSEQAVRRAVDSAARLGTPLHVVLLSSFAVGHGPAHPLNRIDAALLPGREAAERILRGSGLPYTIVRPTWLTDDPPGAHALTLTQQPDTDGMLARSDLAAAMVAAIEHGARDTTFALFNEPGEPITDWPAAFGRLARDSEALT